MNDGDGLLKFVKLLILRGADVNRATSLFPLTPLYLTSDATVVAYLLDHGADPKLAANKHGEYAYDKYPALVPIYAERGSIYKDAFDLYRLTLQGNLQRMDLKTIVELDYQLVIPDDNLNSHLQSSLSLPELTIPFSADLFFHSLFEYGFSFDEPDELDWHLYSAFKPIPTFDLDVGLAIMERSTELTLDPRDIKQCFSLLVKDKIFADIINSIMGNISGAFFPRTWLITMTQRGAYDINQTDVHYGRTLLIEFIKSEYEERLLTIVRFILDVLHADVNVSTVSGKSLLMAACRRFPSSSYDDDNTQTTAQNYQVIMVKILLEHGADIQARNEKGRTCLHYLMKSAYNEAINQIEQDTERKEARRIPTLELLLKAGADPGWTDGKGLSALDQARRGRWMSFVAIMEQHLDYKFSE